MKNRNLKRDLEQLDSILKEKGISRRDAMKMMGLSTAGVAFGSSTATATELKASDAKGHVLIIGGGLAGMSTAARLRNNASDLKISIIEPEASSCSYQPGQTLVGAGLWDKSDILYKRDDFVPSNTTVYKEKAMTFDPVNNVVTTDKGTAVKYDVLIIAAGVKLNYGAIKGLEAAGEVYSSGDNSALVSELNAKGVSSIYTADGAQATWKNMEKFIASAKSGKKVKGVFTHPNTPIKCGGAPKKIMYLANDRLKDAGARKNADLHFYPNGGAMFGIKNYHNAIVSQFEREGMKWSYKHNLVAIENQVAIFDKHGKKKGAYDEDLKEYDMITTHERVEVPFDFIHVTPPMKAPDEIGNSPIGSGKGWVPVNKETLQHVKFDNVFALGDIAAVPMGKTGGTARKQYKVVVNNVLSFLETGSIPKTNDKFDGYTVCPLITSIGTVMLAEFNWASKATGDGSNAAAISMLDPTQERYIWWLLKFYLLKPMTVYGMLAGRA
ncbi:MAG: sulfide:quinone reductase [Campylobacteraceae bacterium 4484_166]|nr:MAG: sulfide:quinone reductase [Campylobacteraceae bacterium 4484_166]